MLRCECLSLACFIWDSSVLVVLWADSKTDESLWKSLVFIEAEDDNKQGLQHSVKSIHLLSLVIIKMSFRHRSYWEPINDVWELGTSHKAGSCSDYNLSQYSYGYKFPGNVSWLEIAARNSFLTTIQTALYSRFPIQAPNFFFLKKMCYLTILLGYICIWTMSVISSSD